MRTPKNNSPSAYKHSQSLDKMTSVTMLIKPQKSSRWLMEVVVVFILLKAFLYWLLVKIEGLAFTILAVYLVLF
uniref:Uncharacterized protein n=1 Tax=Moraxella bovis TaxID=476 RepID=Q5KTB2_MORBO|nr:hypothetical protein [Moraxella bovis Epp63]